MHSCGFIFMLCHILWLYFYWMNFASDIDKKSAIPSCMNPFVSFIIMHMDLSSLNIHWFWNVVYFIYAILFGEDCSKSQLILVLISQHCLPWPVHAGAWPGLTHWLPEVRQGSLKMWCPHFDDPSWGETRSIPGELGQDFSSKRSQVISSKDTMM